MWIRNRRTTTRDFNKNIRRTLALTPKTTKSNHTRSEQESEDVCNSFISRLDQTHQEQSESENNLLNIRVGVKDIFCMKDVLNTCGSQILSNFRPSYDSAVITRLKQSGAIIVGKTNLDEFSMGSSTIFSHFGPVLNPQGLCPKTQSIIHRLSAGGSSGGSAAAVAAGLCDLAIGSDTGGSTRLPAAYCGVIGLKPSYGLISRYGMVQYSTSLDTVGLISRSTDLLQRSFALLQGYDQRDPTSIPNSIRTRSQQINHLRLTKFNITPSNLSNLRVGVPQEYFTQDVSELILDSFRKVVDFLRQRGAQIIPISLPSTPDCLGAYYVIASAEASSNLARYTGAHYGFRQSIDLSDSSDNSARPTNLYTATRTSALGPEVKRRLLLGAYALSDSGKSTYFIRSQKIRQRVKQEFDDVFRAPNPLYKQTELEFKSKGVDIIITPPTNEIGIELKSDNNNNNNNNTEEEEVMKIEEEFNQDRLLVGVSLAGIPSIVVPIDVQDFKSIKLSVGVQVISQWGSESILFWVSSILEDLWKLNSFKEKFREKEPER